MIRDPIAYIFYIVCCVCYIDIFGIRMAIVKFPKYSVNSFFFLEFNIGSGINTVVTRLLRLLLYFPFSFSHEEPEKRNMQIVPCDFLRLLEMWCDISFDAISYRSKYVLNQSQSDILLRLLNIIPKTILYREPQEKLL